jgi:DNA-binding transcriptional regulator YhcF (GntR family)
MPEQAAYRRVVVFLREGILTGKYPGGNVPATAFLARRFHTSPTTVSNAYAEVEKDGLIARGPYRPPIIVARAEPYDSKYIQAITPDGRRLFCRKCWERVPVPTNHVCP